jgi:hypothetical protein
VEKIEEKVPIEIIKQLAFDFCIYRNSTSFYELINKNILLESTVNKKIKVLEKLINERAVKLQLVSNWENYQEEGGRLRDSIYSLIEGSAYLDNQDYFLVNTNEKSLKDYCNEKIQILQIITEELLLFKLNQIPESGTAFSISRKLFLKIENYLIGVRNDSPKWFGEVNSKHEDISSTIFQEVGYFDDDVFNSIIFLIEKIKKEPLVRTGISDKSGIFYINPITYFIDNSISILREHLNKLSETIEKIEYRWYSQLMFEIIPFDLLLKIKITVETISEFNILSRRINELTAGKFATLELSRLASYSSNKCGLQLTPDAIRNHTGQFSQLCNELWKGKFIDEINGNKFKKIFNDKIVGAPEVNWHKRVEMLYFMKLLFDNKIIHENPKNRFSALPNVFLIRGNAIENQDLRNLSAQYIGLKKVALNKKETWQSQLDTIFSNLF